MKQANAERAGQELQRPPRILQRWGRPAVKDRSSKGILRCAIYTRVSTDQGLEQDFNWRCQSNGGSSTRTATAISRAAIYAARARQSAKAAERLCL